VSHVLAAVTILVCGILTHSYFIPTLNVPSSSWVLGCMVALQSQTLPASLGLSMECLRRPTILWEPGTAINHTPSRLRILALGGLSKRHTTTTQVGTQTGLHRPHIARIKSSRYTKHLRSSDTATMLNDDTSKFHTMTGNQANIYDSIVPVSICRRKSIISTRAYGAELKAELTRLYFRRVEVSNGYYHADVEY